MWPLVRVVSYSGAPAHTVINFKVSKYDKITFEQFQDFGDDKDKKKLYEKLKTAYGL
jgi:hypothetical protein